MLKKRWSDTVCLGATIWVSQEFLHQHHHRQPPALEYQRRQRIKTLPQACQARHGPVLDSGITRRSTGVTNCITDSTSLVKLQREQL